MDQELELKPEDTVLQGFWIDLGSGMVRDATWERIEWLISKSLEEVAGAPEGEDKLYRDPADGRFWEMTYENTQLKVNGPPTLKVVDKETVRSKYGI